ncbi:uncharacterized protein Z518_02995 [Rhinocladiella mackenziei CBS 650.93]|uniref:Rhinocladiella mackenziei CBS 650.93 unplaced genomic scaffold supercont1.2, whole genome shotgun sequence n=1 Tax=Rhinocladiella mackenziei CBS 650.93 TaxID=1442369 RepID=A0A0D2IQT5_9EURO|nr:uncharacterized protein Z518_02995 [Rhinocladiella mackenziei CBS 650.93]KIX08339.1 hypothetical protein Z518_02995 [Rhinocladiella mackenziei CBS 650.93]
MWKPPINFITLHYAYILSLGLLGFIIIYPYGNLAAVDAYFFGVSASTESGLNTVDVKALKTYQQLVIYFSPILGNLGFVNIIVVVVRLRWFEKKFKNIARIQLRNRPNRSHGDDPGARPAARKDRPDQTREHKARELPVEENSRFQRATATGQTEEVKAEDALNPQKSPPQITFAPDSRKVSEKALYVPPPHERENGHPFVDVEKDPARSNATTLGRITSRDDSDDEDGITPAAPAHRHGLYMTYTKSLERVASSMFVLGATPSQSKARPSSPAQIKALSQAIEGGDDLHLSAEERDALGGIEYRALKLLFRIIVAYFFGLHLFGAISLAGWIETAPAKYREYIASQGQNKTWWAFYSGATMVNNLGFTLTPDSMSSFQDATFPMLLMTFLAFAGNTCYPVFLRLVIWTTSKLAPKNSSMQEPLAFLLDHPRRCYTLLFPSRPTWILFGILFVLNFIDVMLIIVLDLDNPAINNLAIGPRILAALFQAASSRHTGTSVFNLADVNPAVQFSLLAMMYIAVFPIAISIRASNVYEERSLGVYHSKEHEMDENNGRSYVLTHLRNQLSFDLWYIFLGVFCISIAESEKIMDPANPAFSVFPVIFEVVSAYGNVGLSLGHPTVLTSLCGKFTTFSKVVICSMMIRGRHRVLPYQLDRAIVLPSDRIDEKSGEELGKCSPSNVHVAHMVKIRRPHTK